MFNAKLDELFSAEQISINITSAHENKDRATLNGAILILTDQKSIDQLVQIVKANVKED